MPEALQGVQLGKFEIAALRGREGEIFCILLKEVQPGNGKKQAAS